MIGARAVCIKMTIINPEKNHNEGHLYLPTSETCSGFRVSAEIKLRLHRMNKILRLWMNCNIVTAYFNKFKPHWWVTNTTPNCHMLITVTSLCGIKCAKLATHHTKRMDGNESICITTKQPLSVKVGGTWTCLLMPSIESWDSEFWLLGLCCSFYSDKDFF